MSFPRQPGESKPSSHLLPHLSFDLGRLRGFRQHKVVGGSRRSSVDRDRDSVNHSVLRCHRHPRVSSGADLPARRLHLGLLRSKLIVGPMFTVRCEDWLYRHRARSPLHQMLQALRPESLHQRTVLGAERGLAICSVANRTLPHRPAAVVDPAERHDPVNRRRSGGATRDAELLGPAGTRTFPRHRESNANQSRNRASSGSASLPEAVPKTRRSSGLRS